MTEENHLSSFERFCQKTSLHGWIYIGDKNASQLQKSFWIFSIFLSILLAIFLIYKQTKDFMNATIVTTLDSIDVPLTEIYFPSVVLCNNNQIRQSYLDENDLDIKTSTKLDGWSTHQKCQDLHLLSKVIVYLSHLNFYAKILSPLKC